MGRRMENKRPVIIYIKERPVPKARVRMGWRYGRAVAYTPKKTKYYETTIRVAAIEAMKGLDAFDESVEAHIMFFLPVPKQFSKGSYAKAISGEILPTKRPDLDNFIKSALDGLNGIVYRDDALITDIFASKRYAGFNDIGLKIIIKPTRCL